MSSVVWTVPRGRVSTYGAVARALGPDATARNVGWVLAALPAAHEVPTHRVVNTRGMPLCKRGPGTAVAQRTLLEAEGVRFDARGRLEPERRFWRPDEA